MNSHPLHSIAVQETCKKCEKKKAKLEGTTARINLVMKELNELLAKLQKDEKREDERESPATDELLQPLISPVKEEQ
jgi:hypothetical protein